MYFDLSLFKFISCNFIIGFTFGEHSQIGEYPEISSKTCGITKKSPLIQSCLSSNPFKHHSRCVRSTRIYNGRDAYTGEFPFVVGIKNKNYPDIGFSCSGSIINNKWILTAAHCLDGQNTTTCQVYVGFTKYPANDAKYYSCEVLVQHKMYNKTGRVEQGDIGLIKLNESIGFIERNHFYKINSICLPKQNIVNNKDEFALLSGWGALDDITYNLRQLQSTPIKIFAVDSCEETREHDHIIAENNSLGSTRIGDSGAPVFQYVNGRAVIIGVHVSKIKGWSIFGGGCGQNSMRSTRISRYIDFIKETIKANDL